MSLKMILDFADDPESFRSYYVEDADHCSRMHLEDADRCSMMACPMILHRWSDWTLSFEVESRTNRERDLNTYVKVFYWTFYDVCLIPHWPFWRKNLTVLCSYCCFQSRNASTRTNRCIEDSNTDRSLMPLRMLVSKVKDCCYHSRH